MRRFLPLATLLLLFAGSSRAQTLVTGTFDTPNGQTPQAAGLTVFAQIGTTNVCGTLDFQAYQNNAAVIRLIWNNVTYFPQRVRAYVRCSDGALITGTGSVGIPLIPNTDAQPANTVYQLTGMLTASADGNIAQQTWVDSKQIPDQVTVDWSSLPVPAIPSVTFAIVYGTGSISLDLEVPATTDSGNFQFEPKNVINIKRIACSVDSGTVSINLNIRTEASPNTSGTNVLSTPLTCTPTTGVTTTFLNPVVPVTSPVAMIITATSGSPGVVRLFVDY